MTHDNSHLKTQHVGHLSNTHRNPKTNTFCALCQKDIKGDPKHYVHLVNGGFEVLHPEHEQHYKPDGGDLGFHPLGPECARRVGKEWVHKSLKEHKPSFFKRILNMKEDAPTNSMGFSNSSGDGPIDTYDPMIEFKKKVQKRIKEKIKKWQQPY